MFNIATPSFQRPCVSAFSDDTQRLVYPILMECLRAEANTFSTPMPSMTVGEIMDPLHAVVCYSHPHDPKLQARSFLASRDAKGNVHVTLVDAHTDKEGRHMSVLRHSQGRSRTLSAVDEAKPSLSRNPESPTHVFPLAEGLSAPCLIFVSEAFMTHPQHHGRIPQYLEALANKHLITKSGFAKRFAQALHSTAVIAELAQPQLLIEGETALDIAAALPSMLKETACEMVVRTLHRQPDFAFRAGSLAQPTVLETELPPLNDFSPSQLIQLKTTHLDDFASQLPHAWLASLKQRSALMFEINATHPPLFPDGHPLLQPATLSAYSMDCLWSIKDHFFPHAKTDEPHPFDPILALKSVMDFLQTEMRILAEKRRPSSWFSSCTWLCCCKPAAPSALETRYQTIFNEMKSYQHPIHFRDATNEHYTILAIWVGRIHHAAATEDRWHLSKTHTAAWRALIHEHPCLRAFEKKANELFAHFNPVHGLTPEEEEERRPSYGV